MNTNLIILFYIIVLFVETARKFITGEIGLVKKLLRTTCAFTFLHGPDVEKFPESQVIIKAVTNWYNDKPRRLNQKKRNKYKKRTTSKKPNIDKDPGLFLNLSDAVTWENDVADSERSSEEENTDTLHSQVNDYENDKHT